MVECIWNTIPDEYLEREYVVNGKSGYVLGKDLGCSHATIYKALRKKGFSIRSPKDAHKLNNPPKGRAPNSICSVCGKPFYARPSAIKKGWNKYCSLACRETEKKVFFSCEHCDKEFSVFKSRADSQNTRFCSRECKDKSMIMQVMKTCLNCGKPFFVIPSRINTAKFCSHSCSQTYKMTQPEFKEYREKIMQGWHKSPNTLEERIISVVNTAFHSEFAYNGGFDAGVSIGNLIPDFIDINGKKKVIEVFGDYWHDETKRDVSWKSTEFGRKAVYSQFGYDCLVLWERFIRNATNKEIVEKIQSFLEGGEK